jgi:hypothetical protein
MASHRLIDAYLAGLAERLPADAIDELADGLVEISHHHLQDGLRPEQAARRHSYRRTRLGGIGGLILIVLDLATTGAIRVLASTVVGLMAVAVAASLTRIGLTIRTMPNSLADAPANSCWLSGSARTNLTASSTSSRMCCSRVTVSSRASRKPPVVSSRSRRSPSANAHGPGAPGVDIQSWASMSLAQLDFGQTCRRRRHRVRAGSHSVQCHLVVRPS